MFTTLINSLLESAPYIVLGFLIAGIIKIWVPKGVLQKHLGENSSKPLIKSVGIGALLPLCSCGTIPLGVGLYRSGAAVGNMLAFMTSTPILSPVLIILSINLLGWKLTLTLIIVAIVGSFIIGSIGNRLFKNRSEERSCQKSVEESKVFTPLKEAGFDRVDRTVNSTKNRVIETLRWSFKELGADVSVDIIIGLSIASILLTLLPLELISSYLGQQNISTLIYVILLGIPVYACSIPSIPVVQGLLLLGVSPGAAVAYMIAGPATNLGELNAIRKSMGSRPAIFYTVSLILIALIAGIITDQLVFPNYLYHAYRVEGELIIKNCCVPPIFGSKVGGAQQLYSTPLWHWPFAIVLLAITLYGIFKKIKYIFVNPCRACTWSGYGLDGSCQSECHIKRKYRFIKIITGKY